MGSEFPIVGNIVGFVGGLVIGRAGYVGGNWYYDNFKAEQERALMRAFKQASAKWDAIKIQQEIDQLRDQAQSLRAKAAATLSDSGI